MRKQALLSVSDKTGIVDFARSLVELGYHLLSTGGTARLLDKEGIPCQEVADYTGFPEMLDGRVKTSSTFTPSNRRSPSPTARSKTPSKTSTSAARR